MHDVLDDMLNYYYIIRISYNYIYILPGLQGEMMLRPTEKATNQQPPPPEPKDEILEDAVEEP